MFNKSRRTKQRQTVQSLEKKYISRNQQQNNWGKRMDKWPGGQNDENHCCKTEYRKKNEKKKKMKTA